jgi:hypothetical protein
MKTSRAFVGLVVAGLLLVLLSAMCFHLNHRQVFDRPSKPDAESGSRARTEVGSKHTYQITLDKLIELASRDSAKPIECELATSRDLKSDSIAECGTHAVAEKQAFYILYDSPNLPQMLDLLKYRAMSNGIAGDTEGNVTEVRFDNWRFRRIAFPKRSQFSDDDTLVVTPCIKPVAVIRTDNGELACLIPLSPQEAELIPSKPINTTIAEILKDPLAFNNKLVRVRGRVSANSEYSMITDPSSEADSIWFAFGGGSSPPGLVATVSGGSRPGSADSEGRIIPPFPVKLIRDSNFKKFNQLMITAVKAETSESNQDLFHGVTATFVGRIDGVSPEIRAFHLKRNSESKLDYLGFGQAGQFDAQLIVKSVENDAVLETVRIR